MEKILVPIDFSETAGMAFDFAIQLSKRRNISITLLHAFDFPVVLEPTSAEEVLNLSHEFVNERLRDFEEKYGNEDITIEHYLESGSLTKVIDQYRSISNYDMIVMGTKGASGLKEIFLGSNTEKVIRKAECPVYAIPNKQKIENLKKLLIPLEVEDLSDGFLHNLKDLSHFFKAHLHFLHVDTPSGGLDDWLKATPAWIFSFLLVSSNMSNAASCLLPCCAHSSPPKNLWLS